MWRRKAFAKVKRLYLALVIVLALDNDDIVGDGGYRTSSRSEALWRAGLTCSLMTFAGHRARSIMLEMSSTGGSTAIACLSSHRHNVGACEVRADQWGQVRREADGAQGRR